MPQLPRYSLFKIVNELFDLSINSIAAGLVFGIFGIYIFRMGKRDFNYLQVFIGLALMIYPYFVSHNILIWLVGIILTVWGYKSG